MTERTGFEFIGQRMYGDGTVSRPAWNTFWMCRKCQEGVVVKLKRVRRGGDPGQCQGDPTDRSFTIVEIHPKPPPIEAPEHVPDAIAEDYAEAMDNLRRENWNSAGVMIRRVLEVPPPNLRLKGSASSTRISLTVSTLLPNATKSPQRCKTGHTSSAKEHGQPYIPKTKGSMKPVPDGCRALPSCF